MADTQFNVLCENSNTVLATFPSAEALFDNISNNFKEYTFFSATLATNVVLIGSCEGATDVYRSIPSVLRGCKKARLWNKQPPAKLLPLEIPGSAPLSMGYKNLKDAIGELTSVLRDANSMFSVGIVEDGGTFFECDLNDARLARITKITIGTPPVAGDLSMVWEDDADASMAESSGENEDVHFSWPQPESNIVNVGVAENRAEDDLDALFSLEAELNSIDIVEVAKNIISKTDLKQNLKIFLSHETYRKGVSVFEIQAWVVVARAGNQMKKFNEQTITPAEVITCVKYIAKTVEIQLKENVLPDTLVRSISYALQNKLDAKLQKIGPQTSKATEWVQFIKTL